MHSYDGGHVSQDECAVDVCHEKSGHSADRVHDAVAEEQPLLTSHEVPASPLAGAALTVAEGARYAMAAAVEAGASRMLDQGLCDKAAACAALTKDSAVDSVPEELSTMGGQCSTEACMTTTQALGAVHRAEKPGTRCGCRPCTITCRQVMLLGQSAFAETSLPRILYLGSVV